MVTSELSRVGAGPRIDPLAVKRVTPFVRPPINPDQLPPDYRALLSLAFGVAGLMLKVHREDNAYVLCSYASLGCVLGFAWSELLP